MYVYILKSYPFLTANSGFANCVNLLSKKLEKVANS